MKITNVFDKNGKTLQKIIEDFLIDYCLEKSFFQRYFTKEVEK